jgi:hypothetical protein
VVVRKGFRTVKILEVGQLDSLAHAKNVGRRRQAVDHHPDVTGVEGAQRGSSLGRIMTVGTDGGIDIGPGGDNRRQNHQSEGEQRQASDRAAEPENLTVGNQDDGQVLKDCVHGDREVLYRLGAGIDHRNQEKGDREPFPRLVHFEVPERDRSHRLRALDSDNANDILRVADISSLRR